VGAGEVLLRETAGLEQRYASASPIASVQSCSLSAPVQWARFFATLTSSVTFAARPSVESVFPAMTMRVPRAASDAAADDQFRRFAGIRKCQHTSVRVIIPGRRDPLPPDGERKPASGAGQRGGDFPRHGRIFPMPVTTTRPLQPRHSRRPRQTCRRSAPAILDARARCQSAAVPRPGAARYHRRVGWRLCSWSTALTRQHGGD